VRLQGCFVSDKELAALVRYWKGTRLTHEAVEPEAVIQQQMWDAMGVDSDQALSSEDVLLPKAIAIVQTQKRASVSMLQRQLRIGYSRAARLIDAMERQGIIGPDPGGSHSREVLHPTGGRPPSSGDQDLDLPPL
jgi:S-DNA-T family DNA segregation ATPase FtsK/SpoIIIE